MNPDLPAHVQSIVESICALGCDRVNEVIAALESGDSVSETADLEPNDRHSVLIELRAIMAVYERDQV